MIATPASGAGVTLLEAMQRTHVSFLCCALKCGWCAASVRAATIDKAPASRHAKRANRPWPQTCSDLDSRFLWSMNIADRRICVRRNTSLRQMSSGASHSSSNRRVGLQAGWPPYERGCVRRVHGPAFPVEGCASSAGCTSGSAERKRYPARPSGSGSNWDGDGGRGSGALPRFLTGGTGSASIL